jgi:hypothetical protein
MEPGGKPNQNMIQLVKAAQQQQYAYEYIDDRSSFVRTQKAVGMAVYRAVDAVLTLVLQKREFNKTWNAQCARSGGTKRARLPEHPRRRSRLLTRRP